MFSHRFFRLVIPMSKLAIVRVRGIRNMQPDLKHTLGLLRLHRPNHCILAEDTPVLRGMLQQVNSYVTFGPLNEKTLAALLYKRGEDGSKRLRDVKKKEEIEKIAKEWMHKKLEGLRVFRLHPPRKGHKNIKLAYPRGSLGTRPEMDTLLVRMM